MGPDYNIQPMTVYSHKLTKRERGRYRTLNREDLIDKVLIIRKTRGSFFGNHAEKTLLGDCSRTDRLTLVAYDCASDWTNTDGRP